MVKTNAKSFTDRTEDLTDPCFYRPWQELAYSGGSQLDGTEAHVDPLRTIGSPGRSLQSTIILYAHFWQLLPKYAELANDHLGRTMTLLIFDCDGVLVDSERLACSALAELMTTLGHAMTTEEAVLAFAGSSLNDVLARAEELLSGTIPQGMGEQTAAQLLTRLRRELTAVTGVKEAIAALPYRRCVASSSGPDRLSLSLEVSGLSPLFGNDVFSAAQVANGKPAPDLFLLAARSVGADPSSCIVIEDSVLGIEAARTAGMAAIGFAGASHAGDKLAGRLAAAGADTVIRSMAELPTAVERLVGRQQVQT